MQLSYRYLVNQKATLIADLANATTEYRPVYQRNLNVYRGIDNTLTFEIKNQDQKPVSILNVYTPKFMAFDSTGTLILEKTGTITETTTPSKVGQFTVNISANDLLNVDSQFLSYNVHLTDSNSNNTITYSGANFDMTGTIQITSEAFPGPAATYSISTFTESDVDSGVFYSESITAEPAKNGNEALHTAAVYGTNLTADITIQGTLDNQVTGNTYWGDIATLNLANPTTPQYVNFNGVYSHLRAKMSNKTSGTVDKILVRN